MQILGRCVASDQAQDEYHRRENRKRHLQYPDDDRDKTDVDEHGKQVRRVQAGDQAPDEFLMFDEQKRTRLEAPDHHPPQEYCRGRRARNSQGQHWQHGAGAGGIVRRFGSNDAFQGALAEFVRILGYLLGNTVGHEGSRCRAGGRKNTDEITQDRTHDHGLPCSQQLLQILDGALNGHRGFGQHALATRLAIFFDGP